MQKEWATQGYYCDMSSGYISRTGSGPHMVFYPKELQKLQTLCPSCHESSGLDLPKMHLLIEEEREKFRTQTDEIIATRKAKGDRDPYPAKENVDGESSVNSVTQILQRYLKRNLVTPTKHSLKSSSRDAIKEHDEFYFAVDVNKLVVCECMLEKAKQIEVEDPEEDNESFGEDIVTIVQYPKKKAAAAGDLSHTENESEESIDPSDQDEMDVQRLHSA